MQFRFAIILVLFLFKIDVFPVFVPDLWLVPFSIFSFLTLKALLTGTKRELRYLIVESRYLMLSAISVSVFYLNGYGNFRLDSMFITILSSLPFYVLGFLWGKQKDLLQFSKVIQWLFVVNIGYLFFTLLSNISLFPYSREQLALVLFSERNSSNLIFYLPFVALLTMLVYIINQRHNFSNRILLVFAIGFIAISTFASPLFLVILAYFIYRLMLRRRALGEYVISFVFVSGGIYTLFILVDSGVFGNLGATSSKVSALLSFINSGFQINTAILEEITSQRWSSMQYSISQFWSSPIVGHGAYLESIEGMLGDVESFTTASGGHNFVFDILAFFGLLGLPIILVLVKAITVSYHLAKNQGDRMYVAFFAIVVSIIASNVLNSWLMFSYVDHLVMMFFGFILGLKFYHSRGYDSVGYS